MSNKPVTPIKKPQTLVVVAVPVEVYGDMIKLLQELPHSQVGALMNKLAQLQPQEVEIRQE